jgi:hypothetical protein
MEANGEAVNGKPEYCAGMNCRTHSVYAVHQPCGGNRGSSCINKTDRAARKSIKRKDAGVVVADYKILSRPLV